jgi:hypothetical protein
MRFVIYVRNKVFAIMEQCRLDYLPVAPEESFVPAALPVTGVTPASAPMAPAPGASAVHAAAAGRPPLAHGRRRHHCGGRDPGACSDAQASGIAPRPGLDHEGFFYRERYSCA